MRRGITMLLISSLIAAIVIVLSMNFVVQPLLAVMVGGTVAKFCVLWLGVALVIQFDDSVIMPLASKFVTLIGLDGIVRPR